MSSKTGITVAALLIAEGVYLNALQFDPLSPALGNNTVSVNDSRIDGNDVRDNLRPVMDFLSELPTREKGRYPIIWIGNSHLHAINDLQPGDELSSVVLHRLLNGDRWPGQRPVFGISYPNLTFEEQFLLTVGIVGLPEDRRPRLIIHGVRFHDAREMGVRRELRPLLFTSGFSAWLQRFKDTVPSTVAERLVADIESAAAEQRKDTGAEAWLVEKIGNHVPIFEKRELLYFSVYNGLYRLRDFVFQIDTKTKRPILDARYAIAVNFLDLAVMTAREGGADVLLYNVPLRQEGETPYLATQYRKYRQDLAGIAARHNAAFRDYDDLISNEQWGTWYATDYPDFSHFTGEGHRTLARKVKQDIAPLTGANGARRDR